MKLIFGQDKTQLGKTKFSWPSTRSTQWQTIGAVFINLIYRHVDCESQLKNYCVPILDVFECSFQRRKLILKLTVRMQVCGDTNDRLETFNSSCSQGPLLYKRRSEKQTPVHTE